MHINFDHDAGPDAHLFWTMRRAQEFGINLSHFKDAKAHHERMKSRQSVKKLLDFEATTLAQFAKVT